MSDIDNRALVGYPDKVKRESHIEHPEWTSTSILENEEHAGSLLQIVSI